MAKLEDTRGIKTEKSRNTYSGQVQKMAFGEDELEMRAAGVSQRRV